MVCWLLSDAASYVNGAVIPVDGSAGAVDVGTIAFDPRVQLRPDQSPGPARRGRRRTSRLGHRPASRRVSRRARRLACRRARGDAGLARPDRAAACRDHRAARR